jgi:glyoxalase family protein
MKGLPLMKTIGLHHITAAAKDPQTNLDFYQQVLGQRLIKTTVNFDDPGTYHLYYGDYSGKPGTALTFFPWAHIAPGQAGNGETAAFAYAIPERARTFWAARLKHLGFQPTREDKRFSAEVLPFQDPDGLHLELITTDSDTEMPVVSPTSHSDVPVENQLLGFHSVTLWLDEVESTARILTEALGMKFIGQEGHRYRYSTETNELGHIVDLVHRPNAYSARFGSGSIHHIAFRATSDEQQLAFREALKQIGMQVTEVIDRQYFRSIYFRIPAGVLFEIATDQPGFATDEPLEALGQQLKLPVWFEPNRAMIEKRLAPIDRNRKIAYVR